MRRKWRQLTTHGKQHFVLMWLWIGNIPLALATGLKHSVPYLVFCSIYANVVGHWSSLEASEPTEGT